MIGQIFISFCHSTAFGGAFFSIQVLIFWRFHSIWAEGILSHPNIRMPDNVCIVPICIIAGSLPRMLGCLLFTFKKFFIWFDLLYLADIFISDSGKILSSQKFDLAYIVLSSTLLLTSTVSECAPGHLTKELQFKRLDLLLPLRKERAQSNT